MLVGELLNGPREARIPLRPVLGFQKGVGGLQGGDLGQPQVLDQAVLIGGKTAFHTVNVRGKPCTEVPSRVSHRMRPVLASKARNMRFKSPANALAPPSCMA